MSFSTEFGTNANKNLDAQVFLIHLFEGLIATCKVTKRNVQIHKSFAVKYILMSVEI
jgi:hypothetical protein